ncbi:MAG: gliding motility protein GldM [Bacteroidetes bacterium]|jgi:gliding motility-associated protein GldM|nr:gliding motility protein GldM [Bacteroidota bacterium]
MGHGKETPRQKMIGMMYLVLTALLALNVSKDVLDAFVVVDEGLKKTTENFVDKNQIIYDDFEQKAVANPVKAGELWNTAQDVRRRADELIEHIQNSKIQIVKVSEGEDSEAIDGAEIHGDHIGGKDNTSVPAQVMMLEGRGKELKANIDEYREFLLDHVINPDQNQQLVESIESGLNTDDPETHEGEQHSWESEHFEHLPLIGVLTVMSGMQIDVRNAESDMIKHLYAQIDAGSFKVNQLEAVVIPNSNYIIRGNDYSADIFIAARDTTNDPIVLIGKYDSVYSEETDTWEYEMSGKADTLKVEKGKGKLIRPGSNLSIGDYEYEGLIVLQTEDGGYIKKPFHQSFQVAEGSVVVSPTKMNLFYVGVDNPVDISVAGIPSNKVEATVTNGSIRGSGPYIVNPRRPGNSIVRVFAEIDGVRKEMGSKEFRVKTVPDPVAQVNGQDGGVIAKEVMLVQTGVAAVMKDFEFDLKFTVTEFTVSTTLNGFLREATSNNNRFTDEQKGILNGLTSGKTVYIQDIEAVGPSGNPRPLSTINFKIQ